MVIGRIERPSDERGLPPPEWTVPEMNAREPDPDHLSGVFSIRQPIWSPDSRYLASVQGATSSKATASLSDTGRYFADLGSTWLAWSPRSDRVAVAGTWFASRGELALSAPGDLGSYEDLRALMGGAPLASYEEVAIAPSARLLAVAYADDEVVAPTTSPWSTWSDGWSWRSAGMGGS